MDSEDRIVLHGSVAMHFLHRLSHWIAHMVIFLGH
jgi:hypothetical protein